MLNTYVCTDHDSYGDRVASVVLAHTIEQARELLDEELLAQDLSPSWEKPYTLSLLPAGPHAIVLANGDAPL